MAGEIDTRSSRRPDRRSGGGLRPRHVLGVAVAAVVGILVAYLALGFIAGIVWGLVKAVVLIGVVGGILWLLVRRRRH
jgi:hypothetical protein